MAAKWELLPTMDWLLRDVETLFEFCSTPDGLYGCKGCGDRVRRSEQKAHLEAHREQKRTTRRAPITRSATAAAAKEREPIYIGDLDEQRQRAVELIIELRDANGSYPGIAATLNNRGIAPLGGGKQWYPVTVRALYLRYTQERQAEPVPA